MNWKEPRPVLALLVLTVVALACLLPFLDKAFHMDDPLFIWTAQQVRSHPLDFYGFMVDWDRLQLPMAIVMQNPPLAAYYLAVVGTFLGWSEAALHFGFLLPAVALVLGTYALGRRLCSHPLAAALATIAAPVFVLSSTSIMCDTLMVALWVWAIFFWTEGLEKPLLLPAAAALIAACSLTKYFGICLIPLLFAYALAKKRRLGGWLFYLCLPILVLAGYQWWTNRLYGRGLLLNAASYAQTYRVGGGLISKIIAGLGFTGGCIFISISSLPWLWGKKGLALALGGAASLTLAMSRMTNIGAFSVLQNGHLQWLVVAQLAVFACGGVAVLLLAADDLFRRRTAEALLLFLWIVGTFVFASVLNWTVSGRNILPMAPAVSLLLVRRVESQSAPNEAVRFGPLFWPVAISLVVALSVAWGDWKFADAGRKAAFAIGERFAGRSPLAFEGHWGFQYYFERLGAKAINLKHLDLSTNEVVVVPLNNSHLTTLDPAHVVAFDEYRVRAASWLALMSRPSGAGYYSDDWGPAPFIFGPAADEDYLLLKVK